MILFPAIDLLEGQAVRLYQGDYEQKTVYSDDPAGLAASFREQGSSYLHVVDLEGARDGGTPNFELICRIKAQTGMFVQTGGGIRSMDVIEKYLEAGIDRVILGTAAAENEALLREAAGRYGGRIAVGADLRDGRVAVRGWKETTSLTAAELCRRMEDIGIRTMICTDISRDGAMRGSNRELYRELSGMFRGQIIASGGVSSLEDVRALKALGLYGAIMGKAIYTGDISLAEAIREAIGEAE